MHQETNCVHSGTLEDSLAGGVNSPIFTSSSFAYIGREDTPYPRYFNTPNQKAVVAKLCALEGAEDGVLFGSGMAAMTTSVLAHVKAGDHIVLMDELYGGTHAFAAEFFERFGMSCTFVATDAAAVAAAITPKTKLIIIESPTNPLLGIIDIQSVAKTGKEHGITTIIDSTFASPINQNPLALGIDIVVHSGTKYLGGHSDLSCGVALSDKAHAKRILSMACNLGGSLNAADCYQLERSLKTLAIRVERQSQNASRIAEFLAYRRGVLRVNYPGLKTSRGHEIAAKQMHGFGGMLSFELDEKHVTADLFLSRLKLIRPALSLGGIDSIICVPAKTSHVKISAEERRRIGISDGLLRLSVGIEHVEDLIAEIDAAIG